MVRVKVAKVESSSTKMSKRELYATVCFYYPRYSLKEASQLKARDLFLLLRQAKKIEAQRFHNLTAIAAAPHSKNQEQVKKLLSHFSDLAKD